ncbi:MAG TPA: addiction module protein [Verrucomicrobiae bacterium]|jgi:putative addiction module component (TIGR02574 family)
MSRSFAEVTQDALRLPQQEQLRLARTLLESSEAGGDLEVEAAWEEEIERRIEMVDSGLAKGRSFADVVKEVDSQLGK